MVYDIEELKEKGREEVFQVVKSRPNASSGDAEESNTNLDETLFYINSLEKKTFKKFEFVSERIRKAEAEIEEAKNKVTNVGKTLSNYSYTPDELFILIQKIEDKLKNTPDPVTLLQPQIKELRDTAEESAERSLKHCEDIEDKLQTQFSDINSKLDQLDKRVEETSDNDLELLIQKNLRKLNELEREFTGMKEWICKQKYEFD